MSAHITSIHEVDVSFLLLCFCDDKAALNSDILCTDHFSECVERHAYSTYDKFLKLNGGKATLMGQIFFLLCKFCI